VIAFRNAMFLTALVALTAGCALERISLGFIVPSVVVLALLCSPYLIPRKGA